MTTPRQDYLYLPEPNPHIRRMKQILKVHPEVRELFGPTKSTAFWAIGLVLLQLIVAYGLAQGPWWLLLILSYLVGATINHALFVLLHECTHNLVFKKPVANRILALVVNFPQFFPSSMQFFKYHMLHHTNQSEYEFDADLAAKSEASWIGNSLWKKFLALFFFGLVQGMVRPSRLKKVPFYDGWFVINLVTQFAFLIGFYFLAGPWGLFYLFLSTVFALGLHPLGGRWIQEHYLVREGQETNSYYGPLNKFCFNMGYHNEHHDFMKVPWSKLPKVRQTAPEFYNNLFAWKSWTLCLFEFIFRGNKTFFDRIVRPGDRALAEINERYDSDSGGSNRPETQSHPIN